MKIMRVKDSLGVHYYIMTLVHRAFVLLVCKK